MDERSTTTAIDRTTLRFRDRELEREFRADFFDHVRTPIRIAYGLGIVMWVLWGFVVRGFLVQERELDLAIRYLVMIPLLLVAAGLTLLPSWRRWWQAEEVGVIVLSGAAWIVYTDQLEEMPFDFGYVGLILIMTFSYSLVRMRFLPVLFTSTALVVMYMALTLAGNPDSDRLTLAAYYLGSFMVLGTIASYTLERSTRLLFLRERELDRERARSDSLLLNILPKAIVDRLKERGQEAVATRVADGLDEVTVFFVDMEGFTQQAAHTPPDVLVAALDDLFSRFDEIADRCGLEKIKTVGDAYMAVAGAPEPRPDHAEAAAEMALQVQEALGSVRWPSGAPIRARVGLASGPAVAGVIGHRKFAYDLWGDTVNLASRLESNGEPGRILVSQTTADHLEGRYVLGPAHLIDLKGKGPTPARFLLGRC